MWTVVVLLGALQCPAVSQQSVSGMLPLLHLLPDCCATEGAELFRVEGRVQCASDGCGRWEEQVVFTAAVRVLFWKALARTRVHQTIDASNPQNVTVNFRLLQSVSALSQASSCNTSMLQPRYRLFLDNQK